MTTDNATDTIDLTIDELLRRAGVNPAADRWLRKPTFAKVIDASLRTVDRRVSAGLLKPFIDGGRVLFSVDEARRYLRQGFNGKANAA